VGVGLSCQDSDVTGNMTFPNLVTVGGGLTLNDWRVAGLPVACPLTSITGFASLISVGGTFRMYLTDYVTTIDAFPLLTTISGALAINDMRSLTTINRFPSLTSIGGLLLYWLPAITDLNWMDGVTNINDGTVVLSDMTGLTDISAFNGVTRVKDLHIVSSAVSNLHGFEDLTTITGSLLLSGNDNLVSVKGLDALIEVFGSVSISRNINLTDVTSFNHLQKVSGTFLILVRIFICCTIHDDSR
jgi:hypothetical protein